MNINVEDTYDIGGGYSVAVTTATKRLVLIQGTGGTAMLLLDLGPAVASRISAIEDALRHLRHSLT